MGPPPMLPTPKPTRKRPRLPSAMESSAPSETAQNKRARTWRSYARRPLPVWPDPNKPELWTMEDTRSAELVNSLLLDATGHEHKAAPPPSDDLKWSLLIRALDLALWIPSASLDDWAGGPGNGYAASLDDWEGELGRYFRITSSLLDWENGLYHMQARSLRLLPIESDAVLNRMNATTSNKSVSAVVVEPF